MDPPQRGQGQAPCHDPALLLGRLAPLAGKRHPLRTQGHPAAHNRRIAARAGRSLDERNRLGPAPRDRRRGRQVERGHRRSGDAGEAVRGGLFRVKRGPAHAGGGRHARCTTARTRGWSPALRQASSASQSGSRWKPRDAYTSRSGCTTPRAGACGRTATTRRKWCSTTSTRKTRMPRTWGRPKTGPWK